MNFPSKYKEVLEMARHELITLHGLIAADGMAPRETWMIDTGLAVKEIDEVLNNWPSDKGE